MRIRLRLIASLLSVVVLAGLNVGAAAATHQAPCVAGIPKSGFSGMVIDAEGGINGAASANLESMALAICTSRGPDDAGLNAGFAAIADNTPFCGDPCGSSIVQAGRGLCWYGPGGVAACDVTQNILFAWGRNNETVGCTGMSDKFATPEDHGGAPSSGSYAYQVIHNSNGTWTRQVLNSQGNVLIGSVIAASEICWTRRVAQFFQENWNPGDPRGGDNVNSFTSSANKVKRTPSDPWEWTIWNPSANCFEPFPYPSYPHNCDVTSVRSFDTWTAR